MRTDVGRGRSPHGQGAGRLVEPAEAISRQLVQPPLGGGMGDVELVGPPRRVDHHVVNQHHPLAPVVEGSQLADDGQDGVRMAEVVGWGVRQVLDLPDHVVAEIADQPGVERGQVGQLGRFESVEDGLDGRQHPVVPGDAVVGHGVEIHRPGGGHCVAHRLDGGQRIAPDERVAAPPLPTFHRLEQKPDPVTVADDLEKHRRPG